MINDYADALFQGSPYCQNHDYHDFTLWWLDPGAFFLRLEAYGLRLNKLKNSSTAYVKTFYMKNIYIFRIIDLTGEQVQTQSTVSGFDLGRMSPCSLYYIGQLTQKPVVFHPALYADVFGQFLREVHFDYYRH